MQRTPTVVLGFDALDFRYLDRFESSLPNFSALRSEGVEAPLESTHPPWTGSAWPSMYTGMNPSHHGGYGFFDYGEDYPDQAELVTRNHIDAPALWNYTTAQGDPAVVLNLPVTHPAESLDGVLVPGYLAAEDAPGYPAGIRDELSDALDTEYRIYSTHEMSDDSERKLQGYLDLIEMRKQAATYLLTEHDWNVAVIQVQKTDAVFHNFSEEQAFRQVYEAADALLGSIREAVGDVNIIVCSDHGMGPADGYKIFVNELLREHGFLETTTETERKTLATQKASLVGETADSDADADATSSDGEPSSSPLDSLADRSQRYLRMLLETANLSPGDAYRVAQRLGVDSLVDRLVPSSVRSGLQENVDWQNSKAYARIGSELGIRINLEGREPAGVVSQSEYEQTRSEIIETLSQVEMPDGRPAFEFVKRREEIYDGPFTEQACDIVFRPTDMSPVLTSLVGTPFIESDEHDHKQAGAFVGAGPAFRTDCRESVPDRLSLTDVAPIALAASGYPVPERMQGGVPEDLLTHPTVREAYPDVTYGTDETEPTGDEANEVEDRLADLGYI